MRRGRIYNRMYKCAAAVVVVGGAVARIHIKRERETTKADAHVKAAFSFSK